MKEPIINFNNVFEVPNKGASKIHHSGYVRIIKYLDKKKHESPKLYEEDLLKLLK